MNAAVEALPDVERTRPFERQFAAVTGASSGIGRAIALALAALGASVCAVGRNPVRLQETAAAGRSQNNRLVVLSADLRRARSSRRIAEFVEEQFGSLDILVHSAGVMYLETTEAATIKHLDEQYLANVRGPYALTQAVLPMLKRSRGQVVFINSSVGLNAKRAAVGQYAASHHALRAIADALREEVNPQGVRVTTVHPGSTATPRQERLHREAGRVYRPEVLMQPEDVASVVVHSLLLPRTAEITDITVRPMIKP